MPHTPGPWMIDNSEQYGTGGERVFKVIANKPFGGIIADVSAWWYDTNSAHDNAHLIAAAPELLMALKQLVDCYTSDEQHNAPADSYLGYAIKTITKAEKGA